MSESRPSAIDLLDALRARLGARAAGWWRVEGDRLEQVAFAAAPDMPEGVARGFAEATRSVPLGQADLGIVRAVLSGGPAVSRADDLPADTGSGLWLRRFGASRSVALPLREGEGAVLAVVSVALAGRTPGDGAVAKALRDEAAGWPEAGLGRNSPGQ
jgi:hypothetical protein